MQQSAYAHPQTQPYVQWNAAAGATIPVHAGASMPTSERSSWQVEVFNSTDSKSLIDVLVEAFVF
jgi:hypothetical protein